VRFAAFGLAVTTDFPVEGVGDGTYEPDRHTHLERAEDTELLEIWAGRSAAGPGDGRVIQHDDELGHLLHLPDAGRFSISADGRVIRCAPRDVEPWSWQRGLFAGALPFAALAQGVEVFHAGAVVLDGRLVAITADSGGGKSTLGAFLRTTGASFFTDDVLALEVSEDRVLAHPGPPLLNLRHTTAELLSAHERRSLGAVLGADNAETRICAEPFDAPAPVAALYFLDRRSELERLSFEPVDSVSRELLAASYNFVIRTPRRLLGQLDLCSRLAATARLTRIAAPASIDPRALAAAVADHVRSLE
jgi:hypothetical protein